MVSMFYYILRRSTVSIRRRKSHKCRQIRTNRIRRKRDLMKKESVTVGLFSRKTTKGRMTRKRLYMIRGGMYT